MTGRQARGERTRSRILTAAAKLYREQGYTATRNTDVAGAAGVTIGALYFHFRDKQALFLETLRFGHERGDWHEMPARLDRKLPLNEVVTLALAELARTSGGLTWTPVIADFWFQVRDQPEIMAQLTEQYARWLDEIALFVEALQEGAWVDSGRDPRTLAAHIYSLGVGAQMTGTLYRGGELATLSEAMAAILRA